MTRALLITNPFAARADARAVTAILKILGRGGWNVDLRTITGPGDARRIAEESLGEGFDVLVSHGGDGTAMQVAAGLAGTGIALGLIPGGTGNVLAGNLRLPRTTASAARALLTARPHPIDLGVVERADGPHYFAVAARADGTRRSRGGGAASPGAARWRSYGCDTVRGASFTGRAYGIGRIGVSSGRGTPWLIRCCSSMTTRACCARSASTSSASA